MIHKAYNSFQNGRHIFSQKNTLNLSSHYLFLFSLVSTYGCFCVTYMGEDRQDFVRRVRHKAFTEPRLWREGSLLFYHFSIPPPHQLGKHPHISTSKYINPDSLLKHYTGKTWDIPYMYGGCSRLLESNLQGRHLNSCWYILSNLMWSWNLLSWTQ